MVSAVRFSISLKKSCVVAVIERIEPKKKSAPKPKSVMNFNSPVPKSNCWKNVELPTRAIEINSNELKNFCRTASKKVVPAIKRMRVNESMIFILLHPPLPACSHVHSRAHELP